jgi:putative heme-binding domain-containing protein
LLAVSGSPCDRVLEHSLIYALIEIADAAGTASGLQAQSPHSKRAALIALDQMDGARLKPESVTTLLSSRDPVLKETAWWIAGHHPDWGGALAGYFRERLPQANLNSTEREELQGQLAQFCANGAIQELVAATIAQAGSKDARLTALRALAQARLKETPRACIAALATVLAGGDAVLVRQAVSTARALPAPKGGAEDLSPALLRVARETSEPADVRLAALAAIPAGLDSVGSDLFDLLRTGIEANQTVAVRAAAASALEKAKLSREQLMLLTDSLKAAGPLELVRVLSAFQNAGDGELGQRLIGTLRQSKGVSTLRADVLRTVLAKYPEPVQKEGEKLLSSLNVDSAKQREHLEELLAAVNGGDVRRGQAVFNSEKAACRTCHAMGYVGGKVGPDLTRIGQIRNERDLLESIVYPNASFVRSYEPVLVVTKTGEKHSGVLRSDAEDEVVLATSATEEVRIGRSEIVEMRPGSVSVMPSGLDAQLSRQELADLVAFLKAARREAR